MILCSYCRIRPGEWCCTRLTEKYIVTFVHDLKPGDLVCRTAEIHPRAGSYATVTRCVPNSTPITWFWTVTISIHRQKLPDRTKTFEVRADSRMRRATMLRCQAPICDVCAQDPGEPHRYCPEHWIRLESAA